MKTKTEPKRERIGRNLLEPWALNPRGDDLRGIVEFACQLLHEGVRDDLHVFPNNARLTIMQGHRRFAACGLILAAVWEKGDAVGEWVVTLAGAFNKVTTRFAMADFEMLACKVYDFDEREAFLHLLTIQNGNDPFDSRELATAARTGIRLGVDPADLPGAMHRSQETVQLYLNLSLLPHRSQEAVYKNKMALKTAAQMLRLLELSNRETVEEATLFVMNNAITGEPMSEEQARIYLDAQYFKPLEQQKLWIKMAADLGKKKHRACDGFSFIEWAQRHEFVMEGALPQTAYARAEEHIADDELVDPAKPLTWGGMAGALGVPVFVAPAMALGDKYLLLVKMAAVRDADSVSETPRLRKRGQRAGAGKKPAVPAEVNVPTPTTEEVVDGAIEKAMDWMSRIDEYRAWFVNTPWAEPRDLRMQFSELSEAAAETLLKVLHQEVSDATDTALFSSPPPAPEFPLDAWKAVLAKLLGRPDAVMQDALWKPLMANAWLCAQSMLPAEAYSAMMAEMDRDEVKRRGLRWVFLGVLACLLCEDDSDGESLAEVQRVLGISTDA